ncbi:sensor histidine kinase [Hyalangium rubrum]|uniref:histidine kinase n=1 Tax=Hyalangium rubrum TaxID=3103134 RepID=A0ABU5GXQ8_9BACT|nr:PAS domain-containing protein [Hyalangium sp. s54d21]MDY7225964.1 PAS domain-containing protein [Hyalangium sp. s54d21]
MNPWVPVSEASEGRREGRAEATELSHGPRARDCIHLVLASLPIVLWSYDVQGVVTLSEGRGLQALGVQPGEVVGASIYELCAGHAELLGAIRRALQGESVAMELEYRGVWFDTRFIPERGPDGEVVSVAGMALDISERRRAEEELRESETRYRLATLATSDALWDWNIATNEVHWSENIHRILGMEQEEVDPALEWWVERVHPEDRERVLSGLLRFIDEGEAHWVDEYRFRRWDGSYIIVSDKGYAVRGANGRAYRMVGALEDITQRRVAEQEERRRADFEQLLIGIVSHDLRNPLNAISMAAALLLKQGELNEAPRRSVRRILSSAERATRMLRDLLDFTQARLGGGIPVKPRSLDLHELTRQVVEEVQQAHPQRQLVLEQSGDAQGEWDADRLAQLITNLVNNALTYGPQHCAVRIRTQGRKDAVTLSVHNLGAPIPTEMLPRLFQPLKRGEARGGGGSSHSIGLGLFIVKHIVDAHGGRISVYSTEANGTTFTVRLPRHPPRARGPARR